MSGDQDFDALMSALDYPMYIVTVSDGDRRAGCLVGFAAQCSISPSRFMVWLSKENHTWQVASRANSLAVHVLSPKARATARLFGTQTGFEADKFARCAWRAGPGGVPLLDDCPDRFVGDILSRHDTGDHVGVLLRPTFATGGRAPFHQLGFQDVRELSPGNEP